MDDALRKELVSRELQLLRAGKALSPTEAERLLTVDFVEFGASGRVWTREAILQELGRVPERSDELSEVVCRRLGADAALLTYRIPGERESIRSSLWVHRDGRWQMLFHQGTLVPRT